MEDQNYWENHHQFIAGCDEVGRGPLAGPVVACCFKLNGSPQALLKLVEELGITDSKKLSPKKRKQILLELGINIKKLRPKKKYSLSQIKIEDVSYSLVEIQHDQIDKINILNASLLAMKQSFSLLYQKGEKGSLLIDGNKSCYVNEKNVEETTLIKGDQRSALISMASIVAKEYRDYLMEEYGKKYPAYGFELHAGYPTKKHKEAIKIHGASEIHRKTFKGVKEFISL